MKDYLRENEMDGIGGMCEIRAIGFMNWTLSGDCNYHCTDEDQWTPDSYSTENRVKSISTRELYKEYLKTLEK